MIGAQHMRLWCGFRRTSGTWSRFAGDLGATFVPATWQIMRRYGLVSYVPTLLAEDHPPEMPDEVALLAYRTEADYRASKKTVEGRSYGIMHAAIFDFAIPGRASDSTVPTPWPGGDGQGEPRAAWHRAPSAGGLDLLERKTSLQFIALSCAPEVTPEAAAIFDALAPANGEAAILRAPSFALVWVALEKESDGQAVAAAVRGAVPGSWLVSSHAAVLSDVPAQPTDVYAGLQFEPDRSLRFL
jgi:hypothetical protein